MNRIKAFVQYLNHPVSEKVYEVSNKSTECTAVRKGRRKTPFPAENPETTLI